MAPEQFPREAGDSKARLLAAAVERFARDGYEEVGIRDLARAARCNSALIAFHYGGKGQLYLAAARRACDHVRALVEAFPPLPEPGDDQAHARAEAGIQVSAAVLLDSVQGPGPGRALCGLFLRELAHPDPARHGPALEALKPHVAYLCRALALQRPSNQSAARLVCETLTRAAFPHLWTSLPPDP